jgi:hypothetical protein
MPLRGLKRNRGKLQCTFTAAGLPAESGSGLPQSKAATPAVMGSGRVRGCEDTPDRLKANAFKDST